MSRSVEFVLPEPRAAGRAFDRAAPTFEAASVVHDEARARLLERLDYLRLEPRTVVDLGAATGRSAAALAQRYASARVVAVDRSFEMLRAARARVRNVLVADAECMPFHDNCADLVFANLCLPWCRPDRLFAEAARVLSDGGPLIFSTLGPDTLAEVRRAWASVDDGVHVHAFFDMHDLGDIAVAAGLAEPVLDVDRLEITYTSVAALVADLRACGAVNAARGRRRTLTGPGRWAGFERALESGRRDERIHVTVELILGQAFGRGRPRPKGTRSGGEATVPISEIGRLRRG